ncbi:DUF962 domain-containing protein [Bacteriovoracales bacterium]|nr:DUF962 domain-containing protein [Bacteriovoracales bacterium]
MGQIFKSFKDFYPFYLNEHKKKWTRIFHFIGTTLGLSGLILSLVKVNFRLFLIGLGCAYLLAWISHFFIEKNRPATFKYPFYSFLGDLKMFSELLLRKRKFEE